MSTPFIPLRGGANGPAGLLLAVNPASISHISSVWSKEYRQNLIRLHLSNGRHISVFEEDVEDTLQALGLEEYVGDWVLDLEKDIR